MTQQSRSRSFAFKFRAADDTSGCSKELLDVKMGNLCSCFEDSTGKEATPTTPLLKGNQSQLVTAQPVPSYAAGRTSQQAAAGSNPSPRSVRQHKPDVDKEKEFMTSLDHVAPVSIQDLPPQLASLKKTFQDHGRLYNDQYNDFKSLRQSLNDFKGKFVVETAGIPVMKDCLRILAERCGEAKLSARREKRCIQLEYDARQVSEFCSGLPEDVLEMLELYNKINRLIKSILDKTPQVSRSLQLVLEDEHSLKREVTKSDLPPAQGTDALRHCTDNINRLRKLPGHIETIQKYTEKIFAEILEGSKVLLQNDKNKV